LRFGAGVLALAALAASLVANALGCWTAISERLERDLAAAARSTPAARRAALFEGDLGLLTEDLERVILEARAAGHECVVVSYASKGANVLMSTAIHVGWPMQVLEQRTAGSPFRERIDIARRRGATLLISLRPAEGWTASRVPGADEDEDEETWEDEDP
jgi:2-phospho-L-lactate guanylyltransferase (CobY/MobA/RfbA family)